MINLNLEATLKKAQKQATDTDPEAYRDRVLDAARKAMKTNKSNSIEINHQKGRVLFSLDGATDRVKMSVNGEDVPEEKLTDTIADLDGIGKPDTLADKAQKMFKETGVTKNIGSRSFDAVLRAASNQAKESNRTANNLLKAILMMISRPVHTR